MPKRKPAGKSKKKAPVRKPPRKPVPKPTPPRAAPPAPAKYTQEYREYLDRYRYVGKGRPKLSPVEFDKLDNELIDLLTIQSEIGALSDEQVVRMQELEYLLLDNE